MQGAYTSTLPRSTDRQTDRLTNWLTNSSVRIMLLTWHRGKIILRLLRPNSYKVSGFNDAKRNSGPVSSFDAFFPDSGLVWFHLHPSGRLFHLFNNVHAVDDFAEDDVSSVQPLRLGGADEKLGPVGAGPCVRHRKDSGTSVLQLNLKLLD